LESEHFAIYVPILSREYFRVGQLQVLLTLKNRDGAGFINFDYCFGTTFTTQSNIRKELL